MNNVEMIDKNDKLFLDNAFGFCVIFLKAKIDNEFSSRLSYHLHFLYTKIEDIFFAFCLDTGEIMSETFFNEKLGKGDIINKMTLELCYDFIDRVKNSYKNRELTEGLVFKLAKEQKFWDKFNEIKKKTFLEETFKAFFAADRKQFLSNDFKEQSVFSDKGIEIKAEQTEGRFLESSLA